MEHVLHRLTFPTEVSEIFRNLLVNGKRPKTYTSYGIGICLYFSHKCLLLIALICYCFLHRKWKMLPYYNNDEKIETCFGNSKWLCVLIYFLDMFLVREDPG